MQTEYDSQIYSSRKSLLIQNSPSRFSRTNVSAVSASPARSMLSSLLFNESDSTKKNLEKSQLRKKTLNVNFSSETLSTMHT